MSHFNDRTLLEAYHLKALGRNDPNLVYLGISWRRLRSFDMWTVWTRKLDSKLASSIFEPGNLK